MRLVFRVILILLMFSGSGLVMSEEAASLPGSITGRVVNATSARGTFFNGEVTLLIYSDKTLSGTKTEQSGEDGHFTFMNLEVDPNLVYIVSVNYGGVEYISDPIVLDMEVPSRTITLPVYEVTDDDTELSLINHHMVITPAEMGIQVQEIIAVRNSAPYTYVGKDELTLQLSLPAGAYNVRIGSGIREENITISEDSILVYEPVVPNGVQILYTYELSVDNQTYALNRPVDYHTERFDLFLGVPGATVKNDRLETREPLVTEGTLYQRLSGEGLDQGASLELIIENLPRRKMDFFKAGLISTISIIIALVLLYIFYLNQKKIATRLHENLLSERMALIEEIASLDDKYSKGILPEKKYHTLRDDKKKRLLDITSSIRIRRYSAECMKKET